MDSIKNNSLQEYYKNKLTCHNYTRGIAGFCIHCNKLQDKHLEVIKKTDLQLNIPIIIDPSIIKPTTPDIAIQDNWVLVDQLV